MTNSHTIDVEKLLADQLATASPDLPRGLLSTFIAALMSAEADALCGGGAGLGVGGCGRCTELAVGGYRGYGPGGGLCHNGSGRPPAHTGNSWSITAASCLAERHSCMVITSW